jgi:hypothetical protein
MNRWRIHSFRTDDVTSKRLSALAESEDRSISKMLHILTIEALNQRECARMIRQADAPQAETAQARRDWSKDREI